MNLEEELKKTWTLYEIGGPMYIRGGQIEVDDPMAVSPEDTKAQLDALQIGQKPTGTEKVKTLGDRAKETTIGKMIGDAVDAVALPGDVYSGETPLRAMNPDTGEMEITPEVIKRSTDFAMGAQMGSPPALLSREEAAKAGAAEGRGLVAALKDGIEEIVEEVAAAIEKPASRGKRIKANRSE